MIKYIVYLTINLINLKIYIGQHRIVGDGKDFYLGNNVYGNKPHTYEHPKYSFQRAVKKYGPKNFKRITLATLDTRQEALDLEGKLVDEEFLKRHDVYNEIKGGAIGVATSKKTYQYDLNGKFLAEYESTVDAEIKTGFNHNSIKNSIKAKTTSHGFLWSYEKVDCLDISNYYIFNTLQDIYVYNINGELEKICNSITDTANYLNCPVTTLSKVLISGNSVRNHYISKEKLEKYIPTKKFEVKNKPVYQYDVDGNFLKKWNNITEVWKYFNKKSSSIFTNAIKLKRLAMGYQWRLEKFDKIEAIKNNNKGVVVKDKQGNIIETFPSINKMREKYGTSGWRCLKGASDYYKDLKFEYIS